MLTHKLRMTVRTRRQREALGTALEVSRQLYNAGLEERIGAWSKVKLRIGLHDQYKSLTQLSGDPSVKGLPVGLLRWPLKRLDLAFRGFFSRVRQKQSPGFPRFRSMSRWRSFGYSDRSSWKLVGRWLVLSRIGRFHLRLHRPLEGQVRSLQTDTLPRDLIQKDKRKAEELAIERLKAELQRAFAVSDAEYRYVSGADVIERNRVRRTRA